MEKSKLNELFDSLDGSDINEVSQQFRRILQADKDPKFADRVMYQLQQTKKSEFSASIIALFPKVAAACVLLLLCSLLGIYFTEGSLSTEAIIGFQDLAPEDAYALIDF